MNIETQALNAIERLRNFYSAVLTPELMTMNLVLDGEESVNLRLWALRERHKLSEEQFAKIFGLSIKAYKKYEYRGNKVPKSFLIKVGKKFKVPLKWLECKTPFFYRRMK